MSREHPAAKDRDPRLPTSSEMGSLPDTQEGRGEGPGTTAAYTPSEKEDARMAELQRDYVEQLEALDAERYEAQARLAQVLGWGDFRECSAEQTEEFAEWAQEVGLSHLGNPHIRKELFTDAL